MGGTSPLGPPSGSAPAYFYPSLKDTHREKAPSNKTQAFTKTMNLYVWVVGTLSYLRGS